MATIGEQVNRQNAIQFLTGALAQAGCTQEDADKAAQMLVDESEKNLQTRRHSWQAGRSARTMSLRCSIRR